MSIIENRLEAVRDAIEKAVASSGRLPGSVELMAVSKTHAYDEILAVFSQGQQLFGENRVQEVLEKFPLGTRSFRIHMIGHLQTNKVRKIVPAVDGIDSVDSLRLAQSINKECQEIGKVLPVLLEYNTSKETAKSGFDDEASFFDCLDKIATLPALQVKGLMTIGPLSSDEREVRAAFAKLRTLQDTCRASHPELDFSILSMGMSQDFIWAIQEGSTQVRIGTAIFGHRSYA